MFLGILGKIFSKSKITRKSIKRSFLRIYNFYLLKKDLFNNIKKYLKIKEDILIINPNINYVYI